MMRRLFRRRARRRGGGQDAPLCALLDFGVGETRAAVVQLDPAGATVLGVVSVLGSSAIARPGHAMQPDQIAALAERAISAAEQATARDGHLPAIADDAVVGLTGPLLGATSEIAYLHRPDPVAPIFEAEMIEALGAAQRRNLAQLGERVQATKIRRSLVACQLVGARSVRGDTGQGNRLPDLARGVPGVAGDLLAVAICNLTWPTKGLEILATVLDELELNLLDVVPLAQAIAAALPVPEAILLDVGQEHTELALAEGGALSALASVPLGGQFFTERLCLELHLEPAQAEQIKRAHSLSGGRTGGRPVARVLADATASWSRAVEAALLTLAGEAPLPPRLLLFGGGALLPDLASYLRAQRWTERLPFERIPTVERLLPHGLRELRDPRGLLSTPAQVGLAALAATVGRERPPLQQQLETVTAALTPAFDLA